MNIPDISKSQWRGHKYIKNHFPIFYQYLLDKYPEDILFAEKLYWWEHDIIDYPRCATCGKKLKFKDGRDGYGKFCCSKCANSNPIKKESCEQTCMRKYGVANPSSSQQVQLKISNTNKSNHEFLIRTRATLMRKYGVANPSQMCGHRQKCMATNMRRVGACWHMQNKKYKENLTKVANIKILQKYPNARSVKVIGGKRCIVFNCIEPCGHPCKCRTFPIQITSLAARGVIRCPQKTNSKATHIELIVRDLLAKHNIKFITNTRTPLRKYELDIFIPSHKVAIEINGLYYHSTKFRTKTYHKNKFDLCEQKGIKLLTLWEDEILKNQHMVDEKIKYMLGLETTYNPIQNMIGSLDVPLNELDSNSFEIESKHIEEFWVDARTFIHSSTKLSGKYTYHIYGNEIARYRQKKTTSEGKD